MRRHFPIEISGGNRTPIELFLAGISEQVLGLEVSSASIWVEIAISHASASETSYRRISAVGIGPRDHRKRSGLNREFQTSC